MTTQRSFSKKELRVTFALTSGKSVFPGTNSNELVLTGLRTIASVEQFANYATTLDLEVFGMKQADMNALSVTLFQINPTAVLTNTVLIESNANDGAGWGQIFFGTITECSPEYRTIPEPYLHVQAQMAYAQGIAPTVPLSYPSGATVAQACSTIAASLGLKFQNNGVTAILPQPTYLPGSAFTQLQDACARTDTYFYMDGSGTLAIAPKGAARSSPAASLKLTPDSGLIGYPSIQVFGIVARALFDRDFLLATPIVIGGSEVPAANGTWLPFAIEHTLEAYQFGGRWDSLIQCSPIFDDATDVTGG